MKEQMTEFKVKLKLKCRFLNIFNVFTFLDSGAWNESRSIFNHGVLRVIRVDPESESDSFWECQSGRSGVENFPLRYHPRKADHFRSSSLLVNY